MDPLSSLALLLTLSAVFFYVLYTVVYRAVLNAMREADRGRSGRKNAEGRSAAPAGPDHD